MDKRFKDVYPDYDINKLPSWIREDINNVTVEGNTNKTLVSPKGKKFNIDNKLNDLSGAEWVFFTNSVLNTNYTTKGEDNCGYKYRKIHPSPKPPSLMRDIISFFTKENQIVLDYFMGVGGSLLGASMCNRRAVGIDLNKNYINGYINASKKMQFEPQNTFVGEAEEIMRTKEFKNIFKDEKASLILIDPPYGNMMSKRKTGEDMKKIGKVNTPFTNSEKDLGNMSKEDFLKQLKKIVSLSLKYLDNKKYVVVFIKDMQPSGKELNMLHYDIIDTLNKIPTLYYKGMKIWADQTAKLFPYGYPFSFVATQIHQYILIFRKEDIKKKKSSRGDSK